MDLVSKAKAFALKAHQRQRYGPKPYSYHLKAVVKILKTETNDPEILAAGWLHDTVEDTGVTIDQIEAEFGPRVAQLVNAVTNAPGKNRSERALATYPKIKAVPGATLVKLADRLANMTFSLSQVDGYRYWKMYSKENPAFTEALCDFERYVNMWGMLIRYSTTYPRWAFKSRWTRFLEWVGIKDDDWPFGRS